MWIIKETADRVLCWSGSCGESLWDLLCVCNPVGLRYFFINANSACPPSPPPSPNPLPIWNHQWFLCKGWKSLFWILCSVTVGSRSTQWRREKASRIPVSLFLYLLWQCQSQYLPFPAEIQVEKNSDGPISPICSFPWSAPPQLPRSVQGFSEFTLQFTYLFSEIHFPCFSERWW